MVEQAESRDREVRSVASALQQLGPLLDGLQLYARESEIERVLSHLDFYAHQPRTVLLTGPAASAKSRFINGVARTFRGMQVPLANVTCEASRKSVPYSLLINVLNGFLPAYTPARLEQLLGPIIRANRWLGWLFPTFAVESKLPPPYDLKRLRHGLETVLMALTRLLPHMAIIHQFDEADPESLAALYEYMDKPHLGLYILATVEGDMEQIPSSVRAFADSGIPPVTLPPLTAKQVTGYVEEIDPDLAQPEILTALLSASGSQPLLLETTLRSWVKDGLLTFDGLAWSYNDTAVLADYVPAAEESRLRYLLAQVALIGETTIEFLARLWRVPQDEAVDVVERGRMLGLLKPAHEDMPEVVDCTDPDYANWLVEDLMPEQRQAIHREIATCMEARLQRGAPSHEDAVRISYHYQQAGQESEAQNYMHAAWQAANLLLPLSAIPDDAPLSVLSKWTLPTPDAVQDKVLPLISNAAVSLRLAGLQYRLYPPHGLPVRERLDQAMEALGELFQYRQSLVITYDEESIAFDGQQIERSDITIAARDYQRWMESGALQAIGISRHITRGELSRFLLVLATHEPKEGFTALSAKLGALNLQHIAVLSRYMLRGDLVWSKAQEPTDEDASFTHENILAFLSRGATPIPAIAGWEPPEEVVSLLNAAVMGLGEGSEDPLYPLNPGENWEDFSVRLERTPASVRRLMLSALSEWIRSKAHEHSEDIPEDVDAVIQLRLANEDDPECMEGALIATGVRLVSLLEARNMPGVIAYMQTMRMRLDSDKDPLQHQQFRQLFSQVGAHQACQQWLAQAVDNDAAVVTSRQLVDLFGEYAIHPVMLQLKDSLRMQDRQRYMILLNTIGKGYQQLLVNELRSEQPWYYYRNLLLTLAGLRDKDTLGAVSEKINHTDPRVRAEAVVAAVQIAQKDATPYLIRGLEDPDLAVRARAAAMAGICPSQPVLEALLGMLRRAPWANKRNSPIQTAACLALGHFDSPIAKDRLLTILHPPRRLLAGQPQDEVRAAAARGLARFREDLIVHDALYRASEDRSPTVSYAAQAALSYS